MANTLVQLSILVLLLATVAHTLPGPRTITEAIEEQYEEYEKYEEVFEERDRGNGNGNGNGRDNGGRSRRDVQPYLEKFHASSFLNAVPNLHAI